MADPFARKAKNDTYVCWVSGRQWGPGVLTRKNSRTNKKHIPKRRRKDIQLETLETILRSYRRRLRWRGSESARAASRAANERARHDDVEWRSVWRPMATMGGDMSRPWPPRWRTRPPSRRPCLASRRREDEARLWRGKDAFLPPSLGARLSKHGLRANELTGDDARRVRGHSRSPYCPYIVSHFISSIKRWWSMFGEWFCILHVHGGLKDGKIWFTDLHMLKWGEI